VEIDTSVSLKLGTSEHNFLQVVTGLPSSNRCKSYYDTWLKNKPYSLNGTALANLTNLV
jgi:hypothetical protein